MSDAKISGESERPASPESPLVERIMKLVPSKDKDKTAHGSNWTVRPKRGFDLIDTYGDP